ncbi:MAG: transposase [candidate division WOR-3 bacterium]
MEKNQFAAEQKFKIVLEGLVSGNIAETCRRYNISTVKFYNWKKKVEIGSIESLKRDNSKRKKEEEEKLQRENERLRKVITEITLENLELKKSYEDRRKGEV